jgi:hypothetical protein
MRSNNCGYNGEIIGLFYSDILATVQDSLITSNSYIAFVQGPSTMTFLNCYLGTFDFRSTSGRAAITTVDCLTAGADVAWVPTCLITGSPRPARTQTPPPTDSFTAVLALGRPGRRYHIVASACFVFMMGIRE